MTKKAIAIIPARGGSKRIPRKNIKDFFGKPLISYSIQAALDSQLFDKIIVSTDDEEIAEIAKKYGAEVPFLRPKELSDDFTTSGQVIEHTLKYLRDNHEHYDFCCTIYATAPLLQAKYLVEGFEKLKKSDAINAFSATSIPFPIQRTFKINSGGRCEMFTPEHYMTRSQDLEEAYQDAGQFYWTKLGQKSNEVMFGKDSIPVILPRHLVQDIDTLEDWTRAEYMYKSLNPDVYDKWNGLKKQLHNKNEIIRFKEMEIYFMSVGHNIGNESYGKDTLFLRPVLVYKKINHSLFLGIPLTSKEKEGSYYFTFNYKKDKKSTAMLHQMRVFDIRRSEYYSGKINKNIQKNLNEKIKVFMRFTSSQEEDRPTRAK
jgi:pseudaminic acid cytidylyltransferase